MAPGTPRGMAPGAPRGMAPGAARGMAPGAPRGMAPGAPKGMATGAQRGMAPGAPSFIRHHPSCSMENCNDVVVQESSSGTEFLQFDGLEKNTPFLLGLRDTLLLFF